MSLPDVGTKRGIAKALRGYARSLDEWVQWSRKTSKMRPHVANAFLMGVMLDRTIIAQQAWNAADWMCSSIDDSEDVGALWRKLVNMDPSRLRGFLRYGYRGYAFHRFYKTLARLLPQAAEHLLTNYGGDPRKIWNNQRDIDEVRARFEAIPGIGPALANMAVMILARDYGLLGGRRSRRQIDVKPDVHVQRVFVRTGLMGPDASPQNAVEVARQLAPDFPGSLDVPAWEIGRKWCRPRQPVCTDCPIGSTCPRLGVDDVTSR